MELLKFCTRVCSTFGIFNFLGGLLVNESLSQKSIRPLTPNYKSWGLDCSAFLLEIRSRIIIKVWQWHGFYMLKIRKFLKYWCFYQNIISNYHHAVVFFFTQFLKIHVFWHFVFWYLWKIFHLFFVDGYFDNYLIFLKKFPFFFRFVSLFDFTSFFHIIFFGNFHIFLTILHVFFQCIWFFFENLNVIW